MKCYLNCEQPAVQEVNVKLHPLSRDASEYRPRLVVLMNTLHVLWVPPNDTLADATQAVPGAPKHSLTGPVSTCALFNDVPRAMESYLGEIQTTDARRNPHLHHCYPPEIGETQNSLY